MTRWTSSRLAAWCACLWMGGCSGDGDGSMPGRDGGPDPGPEDGGPPVSCPIPASQTGPLVFERCVLDTEYRNEGAGAFDVDGDGLADVVTDQHWFRSPALERQEIRTPQTWNPFGQYAIGFGAYPMEVNGDGCTDVVAPPHVGDPFYWYEHPCAGGPAGAAGHWTRHLIADSRHVGLENPFLVDLYADGRPVVISNDYELGVFGLTEPGPDPSAPWPLRPLAPAGTFPAGGAYTHGVGAGDLDSDGDLDVLTSWGWFESPGNRADEWSAHVAPNPFAEVMNGCSRMWVYDVNDDGLGDVFCSEPHGNGVHWLEQVAPVAPSTEPTFVDHFIAGSEVVSQMHALRLADLDGDAVPEVVSGTRWCAHCGFSDTDDPNIAYVVYYRLIRTGAEVSFEQHVIDDDSGVGVAFDIADVDGDGRLDIVIANKQGLFVFRQREPAAADGATAFCRAANEGASRCVGGPCAIDQLACRTEFAAAFRDDLLGQLAACVEDACRGGPARSDVAQCEIAVEPTPRQRAAVADVCALCPEHTVSGASCTETLLPSLRSSFKQATCSFGVTLMPDAAAAEVASCVHERIGAMGPESCSYAVSTCARLRTPYLDVKSCEVESPAPGELWIDYCD